MLHRILPARLKNVEKPNNIGLNIHIRVCNGIPHPGLGRKVHHNIKTVLLKQGKQQPAVRKIAADKLIRAVKAGFRLCRFLKLPQSVLFQRDIVIVIHAVKAHNHCTVSVIKELFYKIGAYEPGRTGDKYAFVIKHD